MLFPYFSEVNSCPWDMPGFNARGLSPLTHYMCTIDGISPKRVLSALLKKLNCAEEWPALGIRVPEPYWAPLKPGFWYHQKFYDFMKKICHFEVRRNGWIFYIFP